MIYQSTNWMLIWPIKTKLSQFNRNRPSKNIDTPFPLIIAQWTMKSAQHHQANLTLTTVTVEMLAVAGTETGTLNSWWVACQQKCILVCRVSTRKKLNYYCWVNFKVKSKGALMLIRCSCKSLYLKLTSEEHKKIYVLFHPVCCCFYTDIPRYWC